MTSEVLGLRLDSAARTRWAAIGRRVTVSPSP